MYMDICTRYSHDYNTCVVELWLMYTTAPTTFIKPASMNTGNHLPPDVITNSAVSGPHTIPGIVAYI